MSIGLTTQDNAFLNAARKRITAQDRRSNLANNYETLSNYVTALQFGDRWIIAATDGHRLHLLNAHRYADILQEGTYRFDPKGKGLTWTPERRYPDIRYWLDRTHKNSRLVPLVDVPRLSAKEAKAEHHAHLGIVLSLQDHEACYFETSNVEDKPGCHSAVRLDPLYLTQALRVLNEPVQVRHWAPAKGRETHPVLLEDAAGNQALIMPMLLHRP